MTMASLKNLIAKRQTVARITKIEQQKNKKRVNIFVDDAFFCGLSSESALIFGFKTGTEVDEAKLKAAILDSETRRCFDKACSLIEASAHTKKQMQTKLIQRGYGEEVVAATLNKLEEYHYINDEAYAREFVKCNARLSKKMIENKLLQKGISGQITKEATAALDSDSDLASAKSLAEKLVRGKEMGDSKTRQKVFASLLRRGYDYSVAKLAIKSTTNCGDEIFDEGI